METISGATFAFFHEGPPDLIENDLTNGSYRVMVGQAPVSEGPPMHVHPHTDEGFYIADGEMVFVFPDREVVAGANTFVFVPRGCVHTARTTQSMRGLLIYSPGDAEHITQPVDTLSA
ncbi:MAG TPA: cupin domain-containing protein [Microbacterium sp.]|nr:cupin domain-containing protein [Microbacterium sp.]